MDERRVKEEQLALGVQVEESEAERRVQGMQWASGGKGETRRMRGGREDEQRAQGDQEEDVEADVFVDAVDAVDEIVEEVSTNWWQCIEENPIVDDECDWRAVRADEMMQRCYGGLPPAILAEQEIAERKFVEFRMQGDEWWWGVEGSGLIGAEWMSEWWHVVEQRKEAMKRRETERRERRLKETGRWEAVGLLGWLERKRLSEAGRRVGYRERFERRLAEMRRAEEVD
jgi:hypothetical protein